MLELLALLLGSEIVLTPSSSSTENMMNGICIFDLDPINHHVSERCQQRRKCRVGHLVSLSDRFMDIAGYMGE